MIEWQLIVHQMVCEMWTTCKRRCSGQMRSWYQNTRTFLVTCDFSHFWWFLTFLWMWITEICTAQRPMIEHEMITSIGNEIWTMQHTAHSHKKTMFRLRTETHNLLQFQFYKMPIQFARFSHIGFCMMISNYCFYSFCFAFAAQ